MLLRGLIALLCSTPFVASAMDESLALNPRIDLIRSRSYMQVTRGFLGIKTGARTEIWNVSVEGFVEGDIERERIRERRMEAFGALQEAFIEAKSGAFFFRVGRQPVRWSQSWTLPSLDLFTGRRWNRLFFDPVPEQLIHPDGLLATWAGQTTTIDLFGAFRPANSELPKPISQGEERDYDPEVGVRVQQKLGGFDTTWIAHRADEENTFGFAASYAFDNFVLKTEIGSRGSRSDFVTLGTDIFWGDLSILPQLTRFKDPITAGAYENIGYLPVRYVHEKYTLELQAYRGFDSEDLFLSASTSYDYTDKLKASVFTQKYEGQPGRLFGVYQALTENDFVAGLRLEMNTAL